MTTDDVAITLSPDLPQIRQRALALNLAHYLRDAPLAELAQLTGALAAECATRGIQVAEPLGLVAARLEAWAESDALAMVVACTRHQQGDCAYVPWQLKPEMPDSPRILPPSDSGIAGWYPLPPVQTRVQDA